MVLLGRLAELVRRDRVRVRASRAAHRGPVDYLIDLHAGREIGRVQDEDERETFDVEIWKHRACSTEVARQVGGLVRDGMDDRDAFALAGIAEAQQTDWTARGEQDMALGRRSVYATLVNAIAMAKAERTYEELQKARDRPDSFRWLLPRWNPTVYSEVRKVDNQTTHKLAPYIDFDRLSATRSAPAGPELDVFIALLGKASPLDKKGIPKGSAPVAELLPATVLEQVDEGEWTEAKAPGLDDKSTGTSNAPPVAGSASVPPAGDDAAAAADPAREA